MAEEQRQERAFGWDDEVSNDAPEFALLSPGEYGFEITKFERARHNGSEKLPACNKAIVHVRIEGEDTEGKPATTTLRHNLFLHSRTEGLLANFFVSIGQRERGESYTMDWNAVVGSTGRCKVDVREWVGRDGETKQSNDITRFLEPAEQAKPAKKFEKGKF